MKRGLIAISSAAFLFAASAAQRYAPVPGGFGITNGEAEFSRPLYGWHGDDDEQNPSKSMPYAGDRPKVILKTFAGRKMDRKPHGVLEFGDGTENVSFRYVHGRAEYDIEGKGTVRMVRSADSDGLLVEALESLSPKFDGEWRLAAKTLKDGMAYYDFERAGRVRRECGDDVASRFAAATDRVERLARTIEVKTPDAVFDSLMACQLVAADAAFEGRIICHGVTAWRQPFAGWRGAYLCYGTDWREAFKENARLYFKTQRKDGRIQCAPGHDSRYNMNEVFCDSVLRYWLWTGDDDFMRECGYEGVKHHIEWMDAKMCVPGTCLYENWLNAWNTDDKWCNGGAGTIASAYVRYAFRVMARVAERLGKREDSVAFTRRANELDAAIDKTLWSEGTGVWGEYRERFGLGRIVDCPDSSTIYTAIDCGLADAEPSRALRSLEWFERSVPFETTADGESMIYSSNKLPPFYSSCGLYPAENFHLALAWWQAGDADTAWRHYRSAWTAATRGVKAGPGALAHRLSTGTLENDGNLDFTDAVAMFVRAAVEGLFGISIDAPAGVATIAPGFPADWNNAEIRMPALGYRWTRDGGVEVTHNPRGYKVVVKAAPTRSPSKTVRNQGRLPAKGDGCDLSVPNGAAFDFVDLSQVVNQDLRTLHEREYSPLAPRLAWAKEPGRTVLKNGRAWWEGWRGNHYDGAYAVPERLDIPADGIVRTTSGVPFRLGAPDSPNAVFTAFYDQFPDKVEIPLSGKASKLAFLVAVSTNPNVAWMEAARVAVEYADGTSANLSLVPPDNCDDWLNYHQKSPYHLCGEHIMLHDAAHLNALAIPLDPSKELKRLMFECRGTETLAGLAAVTLARTPMPKPNDGRRFREAKAAVAKTVEYRPGVTLKRFVFEEPRKTAAFVVRVDLTTPGIGFTATERDPLWGRPMPDYTNELWLVNTKRETTVDFMARRRREGKNVEIAVNTSGWRPWPGRAATEATYAALYRWDLAGGEEISCGLKPGMGTYFILHKDMTPEIRSVVKPHMTNDWAYAIYGNRHLLKNGERTKPATHAPDEAVSGLDPRTAFGLTADRKTLVILVVDGRQPGYSDGASCADLADLLLDEGCADAVNMDGGGSSSLVLWDRAKGRPKMLNRHANGYMRRVALNFGITFGGE